MALPEYITGAYAAEAAASGPQEIVDRVMALQKRKGITIPNSSEVLRSEQLQLVMDAI